MIYPIDKNIVRAAVGRRPADADKTIVGSLLSICGSYGMAGAAIMSAKAALRSGIGLLKLAVPDEIYPIMATAVPEAVFYPQKDMSLIDVEERAKYCSAVLCGCGLGLSDSSRRLVRRVITASPVPVVLDADALNVVSENIDILKSARSQIILTPHDREFARLLGCYPEMLKNRREEPALRFAERTGAIVVLKGYKTIVASPDGNSYVNDSAGNAGMATGGSGDVLAGIIASLTAQGGEPVKAAAAGVLIHATAGDLAKERLGEISMLPTDMIELLPQAFMKLVPEK